MEPMNTPKNLDILFAIATEDNFPAGTTADDLFALENAKLIDAFAEPDEEQVGDGLTSADGESYLFSPGLTLTGYDLLSERLLTSGTFGYEVVSKSGEVVYTRLGLTSASDAYRRLVEKARGESGRVIFGDDGDLDRLFYYSAADLYFARTK